MKFASTVRAALLFLSAWSALGCNEQWLGSVAEPPRPTDHTSKLATLLDSLRYDLGFPALAAAIVTDDGLVEAQAVGSRRYAGPTNVTVDDQFHIGSNTKAFTAALMAVLVDSGQLGWTSTLKEIFPEYEATMRPVYREVTVRELLSHSAGFLRDQPMELPGASPRDQRKAGLVWALAQPPAYARGTFSYSNLGYMIAGAIAEKLADGAFEDILIERVLVPLGITSAGFGVMGRPGLEDEPLQHTNSHAPIEPTADADNPPVYSASGRLHLSIGDWAKFAQWILAVEAGRQSLMSLENAHMLTTPVVAMSAWASYALGWEVDLGQDWAGGPDLAHGGSNGFNYSVAVLAPSRRFGFVIATNQGPGDVANPLNPVAVRLIDFYLNGS